MIGFDILLAHNNFIQKLVGLAAGHSYIILKDIFPKSGFGDILRTPSIVKRMTDKYWYKFAGLRLVV